MLENKQAMTEASLVLAIRAASNVGEAVFARELLTLHSKGKHRPQEHLYVSVSLRPAFVSARLCDCASASACVAFLIFFFFLRLRLRLLLLVHMVCRSCFVVPCCCSVSGSSSVAASPNTASGIYFTHRSCAYGRCLFPCIRITAVIVSVCIYLATSF